MYGDLDIYIGILNLFDKHRIGHLESEKKCWFQGVRGVGGNSGGNSGDYYLHIKLTLWISTIFSMVLPSIVHAQCRVQYCFWMLEIHYTVRVINFRLWALIARISEFVIFFD